MRTTRNVHRKIARRKIMRRRIMTILVLTSLIFGSIIFSRTHAVGSAGCESKASS